jgi:putative ABC transport system permease protein
MGLMHDLLYAARTLRRAPAFAAMVIFTLALGIGANTAIFSLLYGVLLRPLSYRDSGRLVAIWGREIHAKGTSKLFDLYSDYQNWKEHGSAFEEVAGTTWAGSLDRTLTGRGPARTVTVQPVTVDFFAMLGVPAALGRTFLPEDARRGCSVVVTHAFWQNVLGSRTNAAGQSVSLDNQACTVLGVMPAGFAFFPPNVASIWALLAEPQHPERFSVGVFGRLKPGVSIAQAQAEVLLLHRRIHEHDRWGALVEPVVYDLRGEFTFLAGNNLKLSLLVLFAAVGFVLLICCVNVANLLLGRALGRQREIAVRAALGAGRARLAAQLLTEALLLAGVAAAGGLALAGAAVEYFQKANPIELPPGTTVGIDGTVLGFSAALGVLTAILFGLFPAWKASRAELNDALKSGGRAPSQDSMHRRFGQALVVLEIVLTVVLLAGAGLLIRSVERFASAPLGFAPDHLVSAGVRLPRTGYDQPGQRARFYDRVLQDVRLLPQVQSAAFSTGLPAGNGGNVVVVAVEGRPEPGTDHVFDTSLQTVSPGYFAALEIPLRRGREFSNADRAETEPVAVVNSAFVQKYFPNEDPIGRKIREFRQSDNAGNPWLTVVGVAGDKKQPSPYNAMEWQDWPLVYRLVAQNPPTAINLFIRTARGESALGADVQRSVARIDAAVALGALETVDHSLSRLLAYPRFRAAVLTAFAAIALLLALVGLYGILSRQVTLRTPEIGIRMALGAQRTEVRAMILKEGLVLTACGLGAGLAAAWIAGRSLAELLYGISASDPLLLIGISTGVLLTALAATWFPARRATAVDPVIALRYE